jgi:hypothetical protein
MPVSNTRLPPSIDPRGIMCHVAGSTCLGPMRPAARLLQCTLVHSVCAVALETRPLIWCTRGYIILLNKFWPSRHHLNTGCDGKFASFRTCGCNIEHIQRIQWNLESLKWFYKTTHCNDLEANLPYVVGVSWPRRLGGWLYTLPILASIDPGKNCTRPRSPTAQCVCPRPAKRKGNQTSWMFFLILPARCQVRK